MIQRKQTLYLLVIFGLLLSMMFCNLSQLEFGGTDSMSTDADGTIMRTTVISQSQASISVWGLYFDGQVQAPFYYLAILMVLATALALAMVMFYKKRLLQIRMCWVLGVLLLGVIGFIVLYNRRLGQSGTVSYSVVNVFPLISLILLWLAYRGIIKDEALVRSLDRLR